MKRSHAPLTIAVASGKGGTGKTTVAVNLARSMGTRVRLLDCDVEEPNCSLFLVGEVASTEVVEITVPTVDEDLCDSCGECSRFCEYKAIVSLRSAPLVFPEMCHGCGGCMLVCPRGAIRETGFRIGAIDSSDCGSITLVTGRLDVGRAMAPPLIRRVRAQVDPTADCIIDCPPGASCPMVASVRGSDAVILVTEPTPFGLHDLGLAADSIETLGIPAGIVVNRAGSGGADIAGFARSRGLPVLLEISDDRKAAEACSRGELLVDCLPGWQPLFEALFERVAGLVLRGRRREMAEISGRGPEWRR